MTRKLTLFALAAATVMASAAPALAQVNGMNEATSRVVRYDDLDLSNERGRERLDRRLRSAANSVCGVWSAKALSEKRDADQCRKTAMEKVQPKVAAAVRNAAARYAARAD